MKLYLLKQYINNDYDTFDSCVVAAENEDDARTIHPQYDTDYWIKIGDSDYSSWTKFDQREKIEVEYLGDTHLKRGVICASFNAG